jgi:predicted  nucleic acid-binding Zn-ribbon protein
LNEEIKQLTELQIIDLRIAKLNEEIVAGDAGIEALGNALAERKAALAKLEEKIEAAEARNRELEEQGASELTRIKERQAKMMQVQNNREYQSLLKEIEDAKKAMKARDEEIVGLMETIEAARAEIAGLTEQGKAAEKQMAAETKKVASQAVGLSSRRAEIEKERESRIKGLSAGLLKKYNRLRERRNGRAVVGVVNGVCQGCFMNIPPQQYNDLMRGDKMLFCPTCQRIIYHQEASSSE